MKIIKLFLVFVHVLTVCSSFNFDLIRYGFRFNGQRVQSLTRLRIASRETNSPRPNENNFKFDIVDENGDALNFDNESTEFSEGAKTQFKNAQFIEDANKQLQSKQVMSQLAKLPIARLREIVYKHHPSTIPDKNADLDTHLMSAVGAYWKESNGDTQQLVARVEEEVGNETRAAVGALYRAFDAGEKLPVTRIKELLLLETNKAHPILINRANKNISGEDYLAALIDALRVTHRNDLEAVVAALESEVARFGKKRVRSNRIMESQKLAEIAKQNGDQDSDIEAVFAKQTVNVVYEEKKAVGFAPPTLLCGKGKQRSKGRLWDGKRWINAEKASCTEPALNNNASSASGEQLTVEVEC